LGGDAPQDTSDATDPNAGDESERNSEELRGTEELSSDSFLDANYGATDASAHDVEDPRGTEELVDAHDATTSDDTSTAMPNEQTQLESSSTEANEE
ncbi:MAG: hypothetical protein M3Q69_21945, partial [Acidobacteriota bacterium]|nr:hypothetical protein [Acidobacteriota bacterium]